AEYARWQQSGHSHAFDALATKATKPTLRQYDPECIVCHTIGFAHQSGYVDEKATPALKNVGCENCHGPGSGHSRAPKDPKYVAMLSPWKVNAGDYLPSVEKLAKGRESLTEAETKILLRVDGVCKKCHDLENDPHFDFEKFWPKVVHGKGAK